MAALILFAAALPFCVWAALSDLRSMKIYNTCNLGLFLAFLIVAPFIMPADLYALRLAQGALLLAIGFMLNYMGVMGGGDAKFIAAMAPYIAMQDATLFMMLLAATSLVTVLVHRGIKLIGPLQPALSGWKSWEVDAKKFPFGLTLGSALAIYLAMLL